MLGINIVLPSLFTACGSITTNDLFPYGPSNHDSKLPSGDDVTSSIKINMFGPGLPFFDQSYTTVTVSSNGVLSLGSLYYAGYATDPFPKPDSFKIIAPFYADASTACDSCGAVYYYQTTMHALLSNATSYVQEYFPSQSSFKATWLFVATWDRVGYFGCDFCPTSKCGQIVNTFQCALISDGISTFAMFQYEAINWTSGTVSANGDACTGLGGYPAQVGFSNGDSINYLNIPESRTANVLNVTLMSNVGMPGRYMFQIDSLPVNHCSGRCSGSVCANTATNYTCQNQCSPNPCTNGGQCTTVTSSTYQCNCPANYTGSNCELLNPCISSPCLNGGSCIADAHGYRFACTCPAAYTGRHCETINLCLNNNQCLNGGTCVMSGDTTTCTCPAGYTGTICQTQTCITNPCLNGGTCRISGTTRSCSCANGYSGSLCQIDACSPDPCDHGYCSRTAFGFYCTCFAGYTGTTCQTPNDPCSSDPCYEGTCQATGSDYYCSCFVGYTGPNCDDNVCNPDPCNEGICHPSGSSYYCSCFSDYTGTNCDVNVCSPNPCGSHGNCQATANGYQCNCFTGYTGPFCSTDLCTPDPCGNHGLCQVIGNGYECNCLSGYTGSDCQTPPDACTPNPCNHGYCQSTGSGYSCTCIPGYTGSTCDTHCDLTCGGYGILRSASSVLTVAWLLCKLLLNFA